MGLSHAHWKETRDTIRSLVDVENPLLRDNVELKSKCIVPMNTATMHLPASIGDYTDFYSSINHATNCGIMFRLVKTYLGLFYYFFKTIILKIYPYLSNNLPLISTFAEFAAFYSINGAT